MGRWFALGVFQAVFAAPLALAHGQDVQGARLLSLSGSQRALGSGNDALYINPAGMALSSVYSVELNYLDDLHGRDRRYNASLFDSQAGRLAGAVAYTFTDRSFGRIDGEDNTLRGHRIEGGIATRIVDGFGVGVNVRYLTFTEKVGDRDVESGSFGGFTGDVGLQYKSESGFAIGAALSNVFNHSEPAAPLMLSGGIGLELARFSIEIDTIYDFRTEKPILSAGAGFVAGDNFALRAGGLYDFALEQADISFGVGVGNRNFGVELGYRQRVAGDNQRGFPSDRTLVAGVRIYFL